MLTRMAFASVEYIENKCDLYDITAVRILWAYLVQELGFFFWCKSLALLTSNSIFTLCCFYRPWWQHWNRFPRGVVESKYSNIVWTQSWAAYCRLHCSVSRVGLKDLQKSIPTSNIQWSCGSLLLLHSTSICSFSQGYWEYRRHAHLLSFRVFHGLKCEYLLRHGLPWAETHLTIDLHTGYRRIVALTPGAPPPFLLHRLWDLQGCSPYFFLLLSQLLPSVFNNFLNMLSQSDHQHDWWSQLWPELGLVWSCLKGEAWSFSLSGLFSQKSSLQPPGNQNLATQTK